ncbi:MAG: NapC/NirT family cytochrome c [Candidatus Latescibacteria bacterium]|nr:NapC/NirT family cytochrome c [Candidatus Latescibacterota bacterium]
MRFPNNKISVKTIIFTIGFTVMVLSVSSHFYHYSSTTPFCVLCHEMKFVAEQGWKKSSHFENEDGVVAQCKDCHIPPGMVMKFWTKTRDGVKDVTMHLFGESDPENMNWEDLSQSARKKIANTSCLTCHENLTPKGSSIKTIIAHRAYIRMKDEKKCLDCHRREFHGKFKEQLSSGKTSLRDSGGNL